MGDEKSTGSFVHSDDRGKCSEKDFRQENELVHTRTKTRMIKKIKKITDKKKGN